MNVSQAHGELQIGERYNVTVNEPRIRETLAWIELHPELWDQFGWVRATAHGHSRCFAGWAYVLATGDRFTVDRRKRIRSHEPVFTTARTWLGLNDDQASALFYYVNVFVDDGKLGYVRRPTFAEYCRKVEEVTGVRFKPELLA